MKHTAIGSTTVTVSCFEARGPPVADIPSKRRSGTFGGGGHHPSSDSHGGHEE